MTRTTNRPAIRRTAAFTGGLVALAAAAVLAGGASGAPAPGNSNLAGGGAAPAGAYPFVAGLRDAGFTRFFCTGTLIESSWVLTAAHCVDDRTTAEVVIGDTDLDTATDPAQVRGVDRIVLHPRWGGGTGDRNDAALLHLSTPSTLPVVPLAASKRLTDGLRRCLQQRITAMALRGPGAHLPCKAGSVHAVGWGRTPSSGNATSKVLKHARGSVWDTGPKWMWRAKTGACPGDSGGPILVEQPDGSLSQIGVASANQHGGGWFDWLVGGRCSTKGWDYYTNVLDSQVSRWITATAVSDPPAPIPSPVTGRPSVPVVTTPGATPPVVSPGPDRPPVVRVPGGPVVPDGGGPILVQ